ncbi:MAG: hypothetical protein H7Y36_11735, partial [Armatimonadetes bacterium]|nr:hypothetical protein [Akkermansiaceae bacterium]
MKTIYCLLLSLSSIFGERLPPLSTPLLFNTPEADAILSTLEVFPADNAWNQVVKDWPLHPDSKKIVASVGNDNPLRYNPDMAFVLVPPNQKKIPIQLGEFAEESDPGPYPVPDNVPIEGWPAYYKRGEHAAISLEDVQRDSLNLGGDRHAIVVDPVNRTLWEFYALKRTGDGWHAGQASFFDLKSNQSRPLGWTSSDAAGLPIFPAIIRFDELKRGSIRHALRVTVRKSRNAFVAPAS